LGPVNHQNGCEKKINGCQFNHYDAYRFMVMRVVVYLYSNENEGSANHPAGDTRPAGAGPAIGRIGTGQRADDCA
jgi:hypothetical protein